MYGKLFQMMYDGSLVEDWKALITFQQLIILCGPDGVVDMTQQALARRTGIPLEYIEAGIASLEQPDPSSRIPDLEGRRIERLDMHRQWGWRIVNHSKYRQLVALDEKRQADRERIAAKRAAEKGCRDASQPVAAGHDDPEPVADVAYTEAEANTKPPPPTPAPAGLVGGNGEKRESPGVQDIDLAQLRAALERYAKNPANGVKTPVRWVSWRLQRIAGQGMDDQDREAMATHREVLAKAAAVAASVAVPRPKHTPAEAKKLVSELVERGRRMGWSSPSAERRQGQGNVGEVLDRAPIPRRSAQRS